AVKKGADLYDAVPTLITDPEEVIESAGSLHCGTLNLAKVVSKYLNGAEDIKIAVTTKPCDAMTIRELMKKEKVNEKNVVMVGLNCGGTLPPVQAREMIEELYEIDPDTVVKEEITKGKLVIETAEDEKGISIDELEDQGVGRRTNCRRCETNIPKMSDLALGNWGVIGPLAGKATFVEVFTDKGAEILEKAIEKGALTAQDPIPKGIEIRETIDGAMVRLAKKWQGKDFPEDGGDLLKAIARYQDQLSKCIKCYGCREACPLCYCAECTLEADGPEWVLKGELPPSPMFHLERLMHIIESCTNCGQCEEVCPGEIPLAKIAHEVNSKIQENTGYVRGMDNKKAPFSYFSAPSK
ncbi:MAG: Coenzyme F420 hydrogenase/dehydrogenase, beta subunit C-terminal domain, partial [Methanobacterium sp.]